MQNLVFSYLVRAYKRSQNFWEAWGRPPPFMMWAWLIPANILLRTCIIWSF